MEPSGRSDGQSPDSGSAKPPDAETESLPTYDSSRLMQGSREILINHHGEIYRLRLTRNDKLILNK